MNVEVAAERRTVGRSGERPRRRVRRPDRRTTASRASGRISCRRRVDARRRDAGRAGGLPGPDRHARAPARAGAGAQGNGRDRHGRGGRRRVHRGRLHAEHVAGQRQRRRDRLHPAEGARRPTWRASIRSAPCRAGRRASSSPTSPSWQAGCVAVTDDGHPVATALLMRRALEYTRHVRHAGHRALRRADAEGRRRGARGIPGLGARAARHPGRGRIDHGAARHLARRADRRRACTSRT